MTLEKRYRRLLRAARRLRRRGLSWHDARVRAFELGAQRLQEKKRSPSRYGSSGSLWLV